MVMAVLVVMVVPEELEGQEDLAVADLFHCIYLIQI
jgi:hypothetical protein